jgi:hypothetical protein
VSEVESRGIRDGRTHVVVTAGQGLDPRPAIFHLARQKGWTLFELHREAGGLEDLFRDLTTEVKP